MKNKKLKIRKVRELDVDDIINVELDRYATFYTEFPHKKRDLKTRFLKRIEIARDWMWVVERESKVIGFLSAQPTNNKPENFTSWEVSTDNGTLERTYNPNGRNIYVVNLDVLREGTKIGAQYALMATLASKVVADSKRIVFFESRMPGFRHWIHDIKDIKYVDYAKLKDSEKFKLAKTYAALFAEKDGESVRYDRLLRFYENAGFKQKKLVANAFEDPESLNFGVVFATNNPVPDFLKYTGINKLIGFIIKIAGGKTSVLDLLIR